VHVTLEVPCLAATIDVDQIADTAPVNPARVHLWAVEEGALLLTNYTVPNLANAFLRERRRVVAAATTIDQLLPDYERPVTVDRIGSDIARRFRSPVPIRQREIEVLWHDSMPLPANGVLELDLVMPELDGIALALKVAKDYPKIPVLLMTGYAAERQRAHNLDVFVHEVVSKPFTLPDIRAAVSRTLAGATSAARPAVPAI